jgi:hypothetical protein
MMTAHAAKKNIRRGFNGEHKLLSPISEQEFLVGSTLPSTEDQGALSGLVRAEALLSDGLKLPQLSQALLHYSRTLKISFLKS